MRKTWRRLAKYRKTSCSTTLVSNRHIPQLKELKLSRQVFVPKLGLNEQVVILGLRFQGDTTNTLKSSSEELLNERKLFLAGLQGGTPVAGGSIALMRLEASGFLDLASSVLARFASQVKWAEWQRHRSGGLCNLLLASHRPFTSQSFTDRIILQSMQRSQQTATQLLSLALLLSQPQRKHIGYTVPPAARFLNSYISRTLRRQQKLQRGMQKSLLR